MIRLLEQKRPSFTSSDVSNYIHIEFLGHHIDLHTVKIFDRLVWKMDVGGNLYKGEQSYVKQRQGPMQTSIYVSILRLHVLSG